MARCVIFMRARFYCIFPQCVKVTIGIDSGRLIDDMERSRSFAPGFEVLDLTATFGLEVDELDIVLFCHRMW